MTTLILLQLCYNSYSTMALLPFDHPALTHPHRHPTASGNNSLQAYDETGLRHRLLARQGVDTKSSSKASPRRHKLDKGRLSIRLRRRVLVTDEVRYQASMIHVRAAMYCDIRTKEVCMLIDKIKERNHMTKSVCCCDELIRKGKDQSRG